MNILENVRAGNYEEVVSFVLANKNIDEDWMLKVAAEYGHIKLVKYFVNLGANIRIDNDYCLAWSSINNHLEVAQYCLENGCKANTQNSYALRYSASKRNWDICDLLLENGADINSIKEEDGYSEDTIRWKNLKILNNKLNDEIVDKKLNKKSHKI